ncbi:hypothetical protein LC612_39725 [Nostoc sp. CHAB 5834]|nr:hypothetical protein [Nostoc sp. CHAB 5834]
MDVNTIQWGSSHKYNNGVTPCIAINNQGVVVAVHQSESRTTLWYHVGRVDGDNIYWGPSLQYDDGVEPSVAITDGGFVIEVHKSQSTDTLWCHVGTINNDSINWSESFNFDTGSTPSVACNSKLAIQTHQSENFTTLWFSTSLIIDRAKWMEERFDLLKDKTFKQIAIPGSHDAGMYLSSVPASLKKTQDLSIYGQLTDGIRYFDLRPKWNNGKLYIHHDSIIGPLLQDVLNDVQRFMKEGNKELVILKFSHYDNFSDSAYNQMVQEVKDMIGNWLYYSLPQGKRLTDIPLENYIANKGVVLVVCDEQYPINNKSDGIYIYRDWSSDDPEIGDLRVFDQYSNTMSYSTMEEDQFKKFEQYGGNCEKSPNVSCDLFLLSWTLTPPTNVCDFSKDANRNLGSAITELKIPNQYGYIINIVYVDYVEYARVTDVCLNLNGIAPR